jgi:regulator of cell morphogenesis and NO signaling
MIREHADEGGRLDEIASLSGNYSAPEDACTTYRTTYDYLMEFETDLHRHIHLENNILFPKSEELEEKLKNN